MSDLFDLNKEDLITMVQDLELQLKDLYLEKRLAGLDRDQIIELFGRLEEQHREMVTSLSDQLSDLYASKSGGSKEAGNADDSKNSAEVIDLSSLRKSA